MNRSLQRHLSVVLASVILVAGLVAAIASFSLAYSEAREFQDDMLRQIAILAIDNEDDHAVTAAQKNLGSDGVSDPESHITILHLPKDKLPDWPAGDLLPGMHTLDTGAVRLRVFVRDGETGKRIVVYQPTDARDEIAIGSALRTLIPLLILLPILVWLIVRVIRSELAPIAHLSASLDKQSADRPQPLSSSNLPQEITPFVDAINRLLERITQLMDQQRRFIADAAHELRSPLTALSLQAQNLKNADTLEAARERVIPLLEGIERAHLLTEQMLNLARIQSRENVASEINMSMMARALIAEYLPLAEKKGIDLGIEEKAPVSMHTDPEALRLILKNALENAIKYTPASGKVTLRLLNEKDSVIIEIVDNGPGISVQDQERVFQPFYRVQNTTVTGSGLGLTIAKEAAIRLGGTLSLHDVQDGSGLVFRYQQVRK